MFAKHPVPGATKSRLAQSIGNRAAAGLSAAFVRDLINRVNQMSDRFVICATPHSQTAADWFRLALQGQGRVEFQSDGGLGHRIGHFFESQFQLDADRVVLIGSDSPDLPRTLIDDAFKQLQSSDAVMAPSSDGGFVLVGFRRQPEFFKTAAALQDVTWSSETTCEETCRVLEECGLSTKLLSPWFDVDNLQDLEQLSGRLIAAQQTQPAEQVALQTLAALHELGFC